MARVLVWSIRLWGDDLTIALAFLTGMMTIALLLLLKFRVWGFRVLGFRVWGLRV